MPEFSYNTQGEQREPNEWEEKALNEFKDKDITVAMLVVNNDPYHFWDFHYDILSHFMRCTQFDVAAVLKKITSIPMCELWEKYPDERQAYGYIINEIEDSLDEEAALTTETELNRTGHAEFRDAFFQANTNACRRASFPSLEASVEVVADPSEKSSQASTEELSEELRARPRSF